MDARISVSNKALITGSTYSAIFNGEGLPAGTSWSVSMGSTMYSLTDGSIVFSPTDGQYMNISYSVSHVSGYVASPFYTVTFTESGLPSCTAWYVNITSLQSSAPITQSSYSVSLTNGTYSYTVSNVSGIPYRHRPVL